jgi:hypothetical protein
MTHFFLSLKGEKIDKDLKKKIFFFQKKNFFLSPTCLYCFASFKAYLDNYVAFSAITSYPVQWLTL